MEKRKKEDLEVVAKAKGEVITDEEKTVETDKPPKAPVSGLEVHTVELPPESKNKRKKQKRGVRDAKKTAGKKGNGRKEKTKGRKNAVQRPGQGNGEKTKIPGAPPERGRKPFWPCDFD